jgi:hypothetical protein
VDATGVVAQVEMQIPRCARDDNSGIIEIGMQFRNCRKSDDNSEIIVDRMAIQKLLKE